MFLIGRAGGPVGHHVLPSLSPPPDLYLCQGPQTTLREARPLLAASEASAAKYPQSPTAGPQEQLSPTPREEV